MSIIEFILLAMLIPMILGLIVGLIVALLHLVEDFMVDARGVWSNHTYIFERLLSAIVTLLFMIPIAGVILLFLTFLYMLVKLLITQML